MNGMNWKGMLRQKPTIPGKKATERVGPTVRSDRRRAGVPHRRRQLVGTIRPRRRQAPSLTQPCRKLTMWGACPTLFDPSQAPPGKHTAFMWEKAPYALRGSPANWEIEKENHGKSLFNLLAGFAPNLTPHAVIDAFVQSPVDTERALPNMKFGDLLVGSFANNQVGYNRPFPGAGEYKTPIQGLYLCGGWT